MILKYCMNSLKVCRNPRDTVPSSQMLWIKIKHKNKKLLWRKHLYACIYYSELIIIEHNYIATLSWLFAIYKHNKNISACIYIFILKASLLLMHLQCGLESRLKLACNAQQIAHVLLTIFTAWKTASFTKILCKQCFNIQQELNYRKSKTNNWNSYPLKKKRTAMKTSNKIA